MTRTLVAVSCGLAVAVSACGDGDGGSAASSTVVQPPKIAPVSLLAVGDIAQCNGQPAADSAAAKTAALVDQQAPGMPLLLLGDLVYNSGTLAEYQNCYAPTYGRFMASSYPVPGNHDYGVANGADYYAYFGARAGPDRLGYYSFDLGAWHIVALNSNLDMSRGSAQETWLRADLAKHRDQACTLAYWHHPRFSSATVHGNDPRSADIWRALYEFKADLVLTGHDHTYERFAPQDPDAGADPAKGLRQFVIGTGGATLYSFGAARANSEFRGSGSHGIVKFVLDDGTYSWQFLATPGGQVTDQGTASCVP
jgi:3',5'-cyclic AMP phosphodiesterase CpdA